MQEVLPERLGRRDAEPGRQRRGSPPARAARPRSRSDGSAGHHPRQRGGPVPPASEVLAADRPGCSSSGLVEVVGHPGLLGDRLAGRGPGAAVGLPGLRVELVEPVVGPGRVVPRWGSAPTRTAPARTSSARRWSGSRAHPAGCVDRRRRRVAARGPTTTTSSTGFFTTTRLTTLELVSLPSTYVMTVVTCCSPVTPLVCTVREPGSAFGSVFSIVLYSMTTSVVEVFVVIRVSVIVIPARTGELDSGVSLSLAPRSMPAWSSASPTVAAVVVIVRLVPPGDDRDALRHPQAQLVAVQRQPGRPVRRHPQVGLPVADLVQRVLHGGRGGPHLAGLAVHGQRQRAGRGAARSRRRRRSGCPGPGPPCRAGRR